MINKTIQDQQSFCKYFLVIILLLVCKLIRAECYSAQMSSQNNNKMTAKKYLQNNFRILVEWWLQEKTGIVLIISTIPVFHWNNLNKKSWNYRTCLGPIFLQIVFFLRIFRVLCFLDKDQYYSHLARLYSTIVVWVSAFFGDHS